MRRLLAILLAASAPACAPRPAELVVRMTDEARLVRGFSDLEGDFRWIDGTSAKVALGRVRREGDATLAIAAWPYQPAGAPPQRMQLWVDRLFVAEWTMGAGEREYAVTFPARLLPKDETFLYLVLSRASRPRDLEPASGDERLLSAAVRRVALRVSAGVTFAQAMP